MHLILNTVMMLDIVMMKIVTMLYRVKTKVQMMKMLLIMTMARMQLNWRSQIRKYMWVNIW
jgi:hypothetical protein